MRTIKTVKEELEMAEANITDVFNKCTRPAFLNPEFGKAVRQKSILKAELNILEAMEIKSYCNMHLYTDAYPYEVIRKVSDICVEVREMTAVITKAPTDFHPGGFSGHFSDNYAQEYEYDSNPEGNTIRVRWSKANRQWQNSSGSRFVMSDKPRKFYDYNF